MLRSAGIRSKILAVLVVPLVLLGITTGLLATQQVQQARQAYQVERIAEIGGPFALLVRGIEAERAVTAAALQGSPEALEALPAVRAKVDEGLASSRAAVAEIDFSRLSSQSEQALARVETAHVELGIIRDRVDGGGASVDTVMAGFADVLREDLAMPGRVAAGVADPATAELLVGFGALLTTRDLALREQEIGSRVLTRNPTAADGRDFATLAAAQEEELARWQFAVGSTEADEVAELMGVQRQTVWSIGRARVALSSPTTVAQTGLTPELWTEITEARIASLDAALAGISADVQTQAEAASQRATLLAALAVAAAVLGVGVTVLMSLVLARRISRPLRELTVAADRVRGQLPLMVEQMRSPGQLPDVELPRIQVVGDDEVGRLAAAFNAVNDTVVEVAEEQAALRGSIAETFVNVARRNQVLLSRQLSFIDQLEQREENPDTLENLFRLDHLATRMRRNAESLLVLANIDAGRKLRQPLALSDVIRTAASEIEQYERVNLALQVDPPTMGHLALQLAHLLAEILENGTNFSEPHTPVLVATSRTATGVRITVTDEGLGLTEDEIEQARAKISDAAADDVVTSQRLGFFVVGRLARRLGVTVSIRRGSAKGLVVTVDLPPSLFVPGTVRVAAPEGGAQPPAPGAPAPLAGAPRPAPAAAAQAPAARPPAPRTATPVPAPGASIPMPTVEPTAAPQVTVTPGGPTLPRRGAAQPPVAPSAAPSALSATPALSAPAGTGSVPAATPSVPAPTARPALPVAPVVGSSSATAPAPSPSAAGPSAASPSTPSPSTPSPSTPSPSTPDEVVPAPVVPPAADPSVAPTPTVPRTDGAPAPVVPRQASVLEDLPVRTATPAVGLAPVVATPGSTAPLPTRARRDPSAAPAVVPPTASPVPNAPAATPAAVPVTTSTLQSDRVGSDRVQPDPVLPVTGPLGADEPAGGPRDPADHPPRRAGLFGAFRARRELGQPEQSSPTPTDATGTSDPTDATDPTGVTEPSGVAKPTGVTESSGVAKPTGPAPRPAPAEPAAPPAAPAPPSTATPTPPVVTPPVATPPVATPPVATPPVTAPPVRPTARPTPVVPAPVAPAPVAPAPVASAPVAPATPAPVAPVQTSAPAARPTPAAPAAPTGPAAEPRPLLPSPVDILPGGARRRGRRNLFGSGRPAAPAPAAPTAPVAVPVEATPVAAAPPVRPSLPTVPAQGSGPTRQAASPTPAPVIPPTPAVAPSRPAGGFPSPEPDRAHPAGAVAGGVPVVPALADGEAIRQRSMLASEALSELSRLSSYSPSTVEGRGGPAPLVRRQPAATEAAKLPTPPTAPAPERRPRSAADVRSMLSGFQSGVTRGRAGQDEADRDEPTRIPTAPSHPGGTPTGATDTRTADTRTADTRTTD